MLSGEEKAQGNLTNVYKYLKGGMHRGQRQALFSDDQRQDKRRWAHSETQEVPSEHQETFLHREGDQVLGQVAQGRCRVSILGDIQKPSGHSPGQLALGDLSRGAGPDDLQRSFPTTTML